MKNCHSVRQSALPPGLLAQFWLGRVSVLHAGSLQLWGVGAALRCGACAPGSWGSVVVAPGLSYPLICGPPQPAMEPRPLRWQAGSQPLDPREASASAFLIQQVLLLYLPLLPSSLVLTLCLPPNFSAVWLINSLSCFLSIKVIFRTSSPGSTASKGSLWF